MPSPSQSGLRARGPLDADSERLLHLYRRLRFKEDSKERTVEQEVSHIRSVCREGLRRGFTPTTIFRNISLLADILIHPSTDISQTTGHKRLVACHNFVRLCGAEVGVTDYDAFLAALDAHLPSRDDGSLRGTGTVVAGAKGRRRPRNPTLSPTDLRRLVEEAFLGDSPQDIRNRAIVAFHCHSGLLPGEIAGLKIGQILRGDGRNPTVVEVERGGVPQRPWIADDAIHHLDLHLAYQAPTEPEGYVFIRNGCSLRPLTTKAVRNIVREACVRVGLPPVTIADLRSTFAYYLRSRGSSDHEVASALGVRKVRTIDRRLEGHLQLTAQRRVHEVLPDINGTKERAR